MAIDCLSRFKRLLVWANAGTEPSSNSSRTNFFISWPSYLRSMVLFPFAHGIRVQAKSSIHRRFNGGNSTGVTFSGSVHLRGMTPKDTSAGRRAHAKRNCDSRIGSKERRQGSKTGTEVVNASVLVEERRGTTTSGERKAGAAAARAADGILIDRVLAGEREPFYELVKGYERTLYGTAMAILKNEADAEEAVQEAV